MNTLRYARIALVLAGIFAGLLSLGDEGGGGSVIGNGAGIAEQNVVLAWQLLPDLLEDALDTEFEVPLSRSAYGLARTLRQSLSENYQPESLGFKSETLNPGFFPKGPEGEPVIAFTEARPGAMLWFNQDRITLADGLRVLWAISQEEALALELELLGFAHGWTQAPAQIAFQELSERLLELGRQSTVRAEGLSAGANQILLLAKNPQSQNGSSRLVLGDGQTQTEFKLEAFGLLCGKGESARPWQIKDLFWLPPSSDPSKQKGHPLYAQGMIRWVCFSAQGEIRSRWRATLKMKFEFTSQNGLPIFDKGSARFLISNQIEDE